MSIPYNENLKWDTYISNPDWYKNDPEQAAEILNDQENHLNALNELVEQTVYQPVLRTIQFIRDLARLVLKVPIRAIMTPIVLPKNWKERERSAINAKLTGYSFVQLLSVPVKFFVAIVAIITSAFSRKAELWLLDKSERWTTHLDGRTSQLEAIKEEAIKSSSSRKEFDQYKEWIYEIDTRICRKISPEVTEAIVSNM
ncbi:MAG: hypothetical protein H0T62_14780 [Parachlamydiaceae bacterium]|nr:hypothetical protein [Parachlamydiaceae bacterium]